MFVDIFLSGAWRFFIFISLFLLSVDADVSVVHGGGGAWSLSAEISIKTVVTLLGRVGLLL